MTARAAQVDSVDAWLRLLASVGLMIIGAGGMYVVIVVLPTVQVEFGIARADASLPYTLTMIGFGIGSMLMGWIADRFGIAIALGIGVVFMSSGFVVAGLASDLTQFALAHGFMIGLFGSSSTFAPLIADTSLWFDRRRGIAVAICASGNYIGGGIWPPIVQYFVEAYGWRQTYFGIAAFCFVTMVPLLLRLRQRPPRQGSKRPVASATAAPSATTGSGGRPLGFSPGTLQAVLCLAAVACCVAMAMPQVHIVAYCSDLGYGPARGAEMLALMLGFGIVSRLISGLICDRFGGLRTLLLGSILQTIALILFLPSDAMLSLYAVSVLFGLFQGGIVPSYAIIVREYFPAQDAGIRTGTVLTASMLGMAFGGWLSGAIFDFSGSYQAAFLNGIGWNLLNVAIVLLLLHRTGAFGRRREPSMMAS